MIDTESARTGYTKLYHPRGPLVSLPVVGDTPAAMFAYVTACLDAGFVVAAPGLEVGEFKEDVGWVSRSTKDGRQGLSDVIAYYSTNEGWTKPFLTDYLNTDEERDEFAAITGIRPESIPEYIGEGRLERGKNPKTDALIIKLIRPKSLVMKPNPKWSQTEFDAAKVANKVYKVPMKIFVRWADAPPPGTQQAELPHAAPLTDKQVAESAWKVRLSNVIGVDDMNRLIPMVKAIVDEPIRKRAWTMCLEAADAKKWVFDKDAKAFRHAAELAMSPPPVAAAPPPPVVPAPVIPPPPPDEPAVSPLIAAWQKKLDPNTVNCSKLNGELMTHFKSIGKTEPDRGAVWVMLRDFAQKNNCDYDASTMKFVERMP